ncbi:MAG: tungsten ABC transporter substrate-binding protein [Chloroflexota bacterium]|nr:MAG: tungsten ABC transporter substrate-binding protein [Chloroflexota bacterium]
MTIKRLVALMLVFLVSLAIGCGGAAAPGPAAQPTTAATSPSASTAPAKPVNPELILATTTSTQDSGLLDLLIPMFEKQTGYRVKPIAVGSGQAMTMGERGEADVLLVHAPDSEKKFMQAGHGTDRRLVMHNDFIVVGPAEDPAKIRGEPSVLAALEKVAEANALFVSRGDNSGTDQLEQKLWKLADLTPKGQSWYQQTGQGMGATLSVAAEKSGYTISDRATYLANKNLQLKILVEGDKSLLNVYHVIVINPSKSDKINVQGAKAFADFMVAKDTQDVIGKFGIDKFNQPLFFPDAGKQDEEVGG